MSAEKKHDYHLVDPSPWPIYTSFACLVLAIGAISVSYTHLRAHETDTRHAKDV